MITHVATAVDHEVSQGNYVARSSKLAIRQQAHAVIETSMNVRLTGRLHSSKLFYSSKLLTTPFVKILTFAPYGTYKLGYHEIMCI